MRSLSDALGTIAISIVYGFSLLKRFASLTRHDGEDDKHVDGLRDRGWQQEADSTRATAARAPPAAVAVRAVLAHQQDWPAVADQGSLFQPVNVAQSYLRLGKSATQPS